MEITVCDPCYRKDPDNPVLAEDVVPQFQLGFSRRKIGPLAVCSKCLETMFPEELFGTTQAKKPVVVEKTPPARTYKPRIKQQQEEPTSSEELPRIPYGTPGYTDKAGVARILGRSVKSLNYFMNDGRLRVAGKAGLNNMYVVEEVRKLAEELTQKRTEDEKDTNKTRGETA